VALTLQTGAPIVNIHAPLNTADGEKEVELILQSLSISDSSSAGQTAAERSCWKTPTAGPWAAMPGPTGAWTR